MKTAISIPDIVFEAAEATAHYMGIPRSQLYALAVAEFIKNHQKDDITTKLNQIYKKDTNEIETEKTNLETLRKATKDDTW